MRQCCNMHMTRISWVSLAALNYYRLNMLQVDRYSTPCKASPYKLHRSARSRPTVECTPLNSSVASTPALSKMLSVPPGWSSRYEDTSYTCQHRERRHRLSGAWAHTRIGRFNWHSEPTSMVQGRTHVSRKKQKDYLHLHFCTPMHTDAIPSTPEATVCCTPRLANSNNLCVTRQNQVY
jgi:hypothetical protein